MRDFPLLLFHPYNSACMIAKQSIMSYLLGQIQSMPLEAVIARECDGRSMGSIVSLLTTTSALIADADTGVSVHPGR